ncbi:MAG: nickel transporter [Acidimicrobiales bacterium]|nr:nickel transporter [Acidimicrobiales bacterium]
MRPAAHRWRWAGLPMLVAVLIGLSSGTAGAHPLGNYTVNHYRGLTVAPDGVAVDYVLDLAEIPTFQDRGALAAAGSTDRYAAQRCEETAGRLRLAQDGEPLVLTVRRSSVAFPSGQGGLATTRIECALRTAPGVEIDDGVLRFDDAAAGEHIGWREVTVRGVGVDVSADVPLASTSARLTAFPASTAGGVPRVDAAVATVRVVDRTARLPAVDGDAAPGTAAGLAGPAVAVGRSADPLAALIGRADGGWWAMALALAVAAGLGALHGLAPGHGKTVVAAFLVGSRGTRRQAVGLAAAVALSHTSGVFVLGGLTLAASATFPLERVYGWLQLCSAVIVLGLGLWLARQTLRTGSPRRRHPHDHDHDHPHPHDEHPPHPHPHDEHSHPHDGGVHRHGVLPHRHRVAWDRIELEGPLRWRPLLALGLSGGLVPSASAVVGLLGAVQVGRIAFGAGLILACGAGLAFALVGVGLGVVALSRRAGAMVPVDAWRAAIQRWTAPAASAALLLAGAWLVSRALTVL